MSTLRLTKDHPKYGKKGTVATVPFLEARDLVAGGDAERWNGGKGQATAEAPATVSTAAFEKAGRRIADLEQQRAAVAEERDELAAAGKRLGEQAEKLRAENKRLTDELAALKKAAAK